MFFIAVLFRLAKVEHYEIVPPSSRVSQLVYYKVSQVLGDVLVPQLLPSAYLQRSCAALVDTSHSREQAPVSLWS